MARVYYHCALGFAGQFTTVLLVLRAYLYCLRAKTFTNERENQTERKRRNRNNNTATASIAYRFNRTVLGIGARLLNLRGYLCDLLQSLFNFCSPSSISNQSLLLL